MQGRVGASKGEGEKKRRDRKGKNFQCKGIDRTQGRWPIIIWTMAAWFSDITGKAPLTNRAWAECKGTGPVPLHRSRYPNSQTLELNGVRRVPLLRLLSAHTQGFHPKVVGTSLKIASQVLQELEWSEKDSKYPAIKQDSRGTQSEHLTRLDTAEPEMKRPSVQHPNRCAKL